MELNLHGYFLEDAKLEILKTIDDCNELGDNILKIIHGHKHGTAIRDYIRSDRFLNDVAKMENEIVSKDFSDESVSVFHLIFSREKSKISSKSVISEHENETKNSLNMCHKCNKVMTLVKGINWYKCPKCGKLAKGFLNF